MTGTIPPPADRAPPMRPSFWRTTRGVVVVVLLALALAAILTFCARQSGAGGSEGSGGGRAGARGGGGRSGGGPGGRPVVTVGVAKATLGDVPITQSALGTVTPLATVNVVSRVSGMLDRVDFKEGQMVRKGQLLAQIDPRPFQVALDQANGQLLHDQALLQNAKADLARYRTLSSQDSIAAQTVDTQAALVRQDEATLVSDRAAVANAKLNLSFTRITSPVAGRIGLRQVDPGNQITANQTTPFAVVTQLDPITVVFSVPEDVIDAITRHGGSGQTVTALDRSGGATLGTGTLATLDNQIDTTTGTVKAKARFANPGGALFPNQFVNVVLLIDTLKSQVVVPTTATRHGPQGDFIWVLQPDRTVKARPVKVGPGTAETVSIVSGLNAGETVITDGGDRLRDGGKVVLPGKAPGGYGGHGGAGSPEQGGGRHGGWRHRQGGGSGGDAGGGGPAAG